MVRTGFGLAAALAFSLVIAAPASAVSIKIEGVVVDTIKLGVNAPSYDGTTGKGMLSYDPADIVYDKKGRGKLFGPDLDISFMFGGQTFVTSDDKDYPILPSLTLSKKGKPRFLDLAFSEFAGAINPIAIDDPTLVALRTLPKTRLVKIGKKTWQAEMVATSTPIPLPAGGALLLTALTGLGLVRLRRKG